MLYLNSSIVAPKPINLYLTLTNVVFECNKMFLTFLCGHWFNFNKCCIWMLLHGVKKSG